MVKHRPLPFRPTPMDNDDLPYTLPEEDPFNIMPRLSQPRRRRSSMLNKWIQDQQNLPKAHDFLDVPKDPSLPPSGTHANPYLAYPDLGRGTLPLNVQGSAVTLNSYDLVEDEDIPPEAEVALPETPHTPVTSRSQRSSRLFHTPTSFRSISLSFRSNSPASRSPSSLSPCTSTPSRMSFSLLPPRFSPNSSRNTPKQHNRSSSLGTLSIPSGGPVPDASPSPKWRPSVLNYFGSSAASQVSANPSDTIYAPSRPSISSSHTATSGTVAPESTSASPSKLSLVDSVRSRNPSGTSLLRSTPESTITPLCEDGDECACDPPPSDPKKEKAILRVPLALKSSSNANVDIDEEKRALMLSMTVLDPNQPRLAFTSSKPGAIRSRVSFSLNSRNPKKKKLIISGIGPNDVRKFEGARRWCESFGEVTHIMRMPNGDLHVYFKSADVADTVCRLRAKVFISGVGSVNLSWYTGNRR